MSYLLHMIIYDLSIHIVPYLIKASDITFRRLAGDYKIEAAIVSYTK